MPLLLRETDVEELLTMDDALTAVEEAFQLQGLGKADNHPRQRPCLEHTMLQVMPAALPGIGFGLKAYTVASRGVRFVVLLWDEETGDLQAMVEAGHLGQMRTGAASGVATKYLARPDAVTVGIFGTGTQAPAQLEAICAVRSIEQIWVYSRSSEHRICFAQEMAELLSISVEAVENPQAAVSDADIVITSTTAAEPLFDGSWLPPGVHINATGSNRRDAQELDTRTVEKANLIVIDDLVQGRIEAGDLIAAERHGVFTWDSVVELGQVVTGDHHGRQDDAGCTLFESLGVAIEDLSVARCVYEKAVALGAGEQLPETMLE